MDFIGEVVDGWLITAQLGMGGFGHVMEAEKDGVVGALKMEKRSKVNSIFREYSEMRRLKAFGIAPQVFAEGSVREYEYLVMEKLDSTLSDQFLHVNVGEVARDLINALRCLHHPERSSVVFADLKPANVMWKAASKRWMLVDFGSCLPPMSGKVLPFNGTELFAADRAIFEGGTCCLDDLEALVYTLYWCIQKGQVRWSRTFTGAPDVTGKLKAQRLAKMCAARAAELEQFSLSALKSRLEPNRTIAAFWNAVIHLRDEKQAVAPPEFYDHWISKFSAESNSVHTTTKRVGRKRDRSLSDIGVRQHNMTTRSLSREREAASESPARVSRKLHLLVKPKR